MDQQVDDTSDLKVEIKEEFENVEADQEDQEAPVENPTKIISAPEYLGLFFVATSGQNGPNLGCDEEEIVLLVLSIIKISTNEVLVRKSFIAKPTTSDLTTENLLSEECVAEFGLNEDGVRVGGKPLELLIEQIDEIVGSVVDNVENFVLVVDGQLPLRQCLHQEASAKEINLPHYYNSFFDLKKEFTSSHHISFETLDEIMTHLNLELPIPSDVDENYNEPLGKIQEMTLIVQEMLRRGHRFEAPETISMKLEPGLCSKNEEVDGQTVVRARGLPWQSSDADIAKFFRGLNIAKGGVALCLSPQGRRNGEALIRFECGEHRELALRRHKHHIGTRYIEVYKATGDDFIGVAGGSNNEAQAFLSRGGQVIVRMRGLPYDCTAKQVLEFFESDENGCKVFDDEDGVLFVRRPDGRATGDAFVLFGAEEDAGKALSKHRESIGSRYIELFRSTTAEVQQVLNRCIESIAKSAIETNGVGLGSPVGVVSNGGPLNTLPPQLPLPLLSQQLITIGTLKDCIRLRGLPYEAQVQHILDFLEDHSNKIVRQGVHMVYNSQGQPSGEAFIQMDSEQSAYLAAEEKHRQYMIYFKKQRYIEVFQCSGEDMNLVLAGGIPLSPQKALISPGRTLLAPAPYGAYPYPQGPQLPVTQMPNRNNCSHPFVYPPTPIFYWPYPSPPMSPTTYYGPPITVPPPPQLVNISGDCMGKGNGVGPLQPHPHYHHLPPLHGPNGLFEIGQRVMNGGEFTLSDKHHQLRLQPTLIHAKNYMELPPFMA